MVMATIQVYAMVGGVQAQLDSSTGLVELEAGLGFGVSAGRPYFAPAGAAPGEGAVLSVDPVTGGLVLTGGGLELGPPRTVRSRAAESEPAMPADHRTVSSRGPVRPAADHEPPRPVQSRAKPASRPEHVPPQPVVTRDPLPDMRDPRPRPVTPEPVNAHADPRAPSHINPVPIRDRAPAAEKPIHAPLRTITVRAPLPDHEDPRDRPSGPIAPKTIPPDVRDPRARARGPVAPKDTLAEHTDPRRRHAGPVNP